MGPVQQLVELDDAAVDPRRGRGHAAPARPAARPGASCAFARPYRRDIAVFLVTVVLGGRHRGGHPGAGRRRGQRDHRRRPRRRRRRSSGSRCSSPALAVVDAFLSLAQRWYSARIGEGIILDLRTQVYDHVQRMPLQFFTRTQTGALVSRLNNDVIGAQRAFTSTLSGVVSNVIQLVLTAAVMFTLSWQITAAVAGAAAGVHHPGPPGRQAAGRDHPRVVQPRREDERDDDRAVRRRRRAAGQAVRPARRRGGPVRRAGRAGPRHRRPAGDVLPHLLRRDAAGRLARAGADLRAGRLARGHRQRHRRHRGHPGAAAHPALRPAHRAVATSGST